jgi:hypothetical protein
MHKHILSVTPAGTTGSATGSASIALTRFGELHAVFMDFGSITSDTVTRLELVDPVNQMLTLTGVTTDAWYFPRSTLNTNTGATYTSTAGMVRYPLVGTLVLRASSSTPTANGVEAHVYVEEL